MLERARVSVLAVLCSIAQFVLCIPFLIREPLFVREDWQFIRRATELGYWNAADPVTAHARPLVKVVYSGLYAVASESPVLAHIITALIGSVVAAAIFVLLVQWIDRKWALATTLVWVCLPTHLTLDHWLPATNIAMSASATCFALAVLAADPRSSRRQIATMLLGALAIALYEPVIVAIAFGLLFTVIIRARDVWLSIVVRYTPLALLAIVILMRTGDGRDNRVYVSVLQSITQNLGVVTTLTTGKTLIASVLVLLSTVPLLRSMLRRQYLDQATAQAAVGLAIVVIGYLPFMQAGGNAAFYGIGDRYNVVSSVGAAILVTGVARVWLAQRFAITAVAAIALLLIPINVARSVAWADAMQVTERNGQRVLAQYPDGPIPMWSVHEWPWPGPLHVDPTLELRQFLEGNWKHEPREVRDVYDENLRASAVDAAELRYHSEDSVKCPKLSFECPSP